MAALVAPVLRANYTISTDLCGETQSFHDLLYDLAGDNDQRVVQGLADALIYDPRGSDCPFYGDDRTIR